VTGVGQADTGRTRLWKYTLLVTASPIIAACAGLALVPLTLTNQALLTLAGLATGVAAGLWAERAVLRASLRARERETVDLLAQWRAYHALAEGGADWLWQCDADLRVTQFVGRLQETIGTDPAALIGANAIRAAGGDPRNPPWNRVVELVAAQAPIPEFEYTYRDKDGGIRHLRASAQPKFDADGTFAGYIGLVRDVTEPREATSRAERTEQQLRAALSGAQAGFALWDSENRLVWCNDHYQGMWPEAADILVPGLPFEKLVRRIGEQRIETGGVDLETFVANWIAIRRKGGAGTCQLRDGRWTSYTEQHTPVGEVVQVCMDITHFKKREEEIAERSDILRHTFDNIDQGVVLTTNQGRILAYNRRLLDMFGLPEDVFAKRAHMDVFFRHLAAQADLGPGDPDAVAAAKLHNFLERQHGGGDNMCEGVRSDGTIIEVVNRQLPDNRYIKTFSDVTERRRAEQELRASEARYRFLLDAVPELVAQLDEGVIRYINPTGGLMLGASDTDALLGRPFADFLVGRDLPPPTASSECSRFHWTTCDLKGTDGALVKVEIVRLSMNGVGLSGDLMIARDMTQRLEIEQSLRMAKDAAELANRAKTQFLANISHELRTPLNAIIGFAELLGLEMAADGKRRLEYANDIHVSGRHLLAIINDILDYSKIEAGRQDLSESKVDLAELIAGSRRVVMGRADEAGVAVHLHLRDDLPPVLADSLKVRQILLNLLSNSVKFTPRGGRVDVTAERDAGGGIAISVSDTGIGMTDREIQIALEPFGQVANAMVRGHDGTGLGLPLARALAELHGAGFELESEPGKGTRVTVRIPPARVLEPAAPFFTHMIEGAAD